MKQKIYLGIEKLRNIINKISVKEILLISKSKNLDTINLIKSLNINYTKFQNFTANPTLEDAQKGLEIFKSGNYDAILAIGGGSTIDVAKYIKLNINKPLIAIPTTAGSGSESTGFAVIYKDGEKQSLSGALPEYVILESSFLKTLPLYQKKCTMLDALCQAIEAYWSKNSTLKSRKYSKQAIKLITKNYAEYINENERVYKSILIASNKAGKAINIAKTTAAHAMSYKITSMLGLPHGHAVAICLPPVWKFMKENTNLCTHPKGEVYIKKNLKGLSKFISLEMFNQILKELEIYPPEKFSKSQLNKLVASVNIERLSNLPIALSSNVLEKLYIDIVQLAQITNAQD